MNDVDRNRHAVLSNVVQASRRWRKLAQQALAAHGISQARATALVWVYRLGGGVRQVTLASYVGIEGTSLVRLLDELTASGLLGRREDAEDRRAKTIWLTSEGERLAEQVEEVLAALKARVLDGVSLADIDATLRVCEAVQRASEKICVESSSAASDDLSCNEASVG